MNQAVKERIEKIIRGEVPEGYKSTKSGSIPLSWNSVKLRKLATPIKEKVQNRRLEVLSITAGVGFVNQADKFGKEIAGAQYQNYTVLRKGDFSYNKGNSKTYPQGCIYMLEDRDEAAVPNVFISFRFKAGIHTYYYKHLFINGFFNRQLYRHINTGVRNDGLLNLYDDDFYDCELPVPPLHEQEKIAEILSTWDKAILLMEKLIEEKKKQKKWLMQNLLNPDSGVRLPGFEESTWEIKSIEDIGNVVTGSTPSTKIKKYWDNKYPWITPTDITKKYVSVSEKSLSEEGIKIGRLIPAGSILVTCIASIGKIAILTRDGSCNQQINAITAKDGFYPEFIYYIMENAHKEFNMYTGITTTPIISLSTFVKMKFSFPSKTEQVAIANVLTTADREIDLLEQKLEQLQKQKKALMQLLLTGIVRVRT